MFNLKYYKTLNSTNKYLKENISTFNDRDVLLTFNQTNGKGRESRSFLSSNDSLTFSILFKDKAIVNRFKNLSLMIACSVFNVLSKYTSNVKIKWPNDVYVNDAKICGILLEGISFNELEDVIIGVGLNVNNDKSFINSIKDRKITSLYNETNNKYDLYKILYEILDDFDKLLVSNKEYLNIIRNNNYLKDKYGLYDNHEVKIIDISDENQLIVEDNGVIRYLEVGEIIL